MTDKRDDDELTDFGLAEDDSNEPAVRPASRWRSLIRDVNFILGMAVRTVVIIGGVLTYIQYSHSVKREQIQRSFELVDLWQGEKMQSSQNALQTEILKLARDAKSLSESSGNSLDPAFTQKVVADRLWDEIAAGGELSTAFFDVLFFLNRASYCATSDLCDKPVIDDFFKDYAKQFWSYFGENLERSRATDTHPIKTYLEGRP